MAYKQTSNSVSRWSNILLRYKPHPGEWAWMLHRVSGVALTVYLFVHIWALRGLTTGRSAFEAEMDLFTTPIFKFLEWGLFAFVIFHSLNGLRVAIVDLASKNASRQKALLRIVYTVGIAAMIFMGVLIFLNPFGDETAENAGTTSAGQVQPQ